MGRFLKADLGKKKKKNPEREERNVFLEEEGWHVLFALICTLKSEV